MRQCQNSVLRPGVLSASLSTFFTEMVLKKILEKPVFKINKIVEVLYSKKGAARLWKCT